MGVDKGVGIPVATTVGWMAVAKLEVAMAGGKEV